MEKEEPGENGNETPIAGGVRTRTQKTGDQKGERTQLSTPTTRPEKRVAMRERGGQGVVQKQNVKNLSFSLQIVTKEKASIST